MVVHTLTKSVSLSSLDATINNADEYLLFQIELVFYLELLDLLDICSNELLLHTQTAITLIKPFMTIVYVNIAGEFKLRNKVTS